MASVNAKAQVIGNLKEVYSEKGILELVGANKKLIGNLGPITESTRVGRKFIQPVDLVMEQGFVYAPSGTTPTLATPIAGETLNAEVEGSQIIGRVRADYEILASALKQGKQAFMAASRLLVKRAALACTKRREIDILHGRDGIGIIGTQGSGTTTRTMTITDASWAGGIWAGLKGAELDAYDTTLSTQTKLNTTGALTISSINLSAKTVTLTGAAADLTACVATSVLYLRTSSFANSAAGISKILSNTGTLFGIDAATYEMWGGNTYAVGGALTLSKILEAVSLAATYDAPEKLLVVLSPKAFEKLNSDQSALRKYDASYRAVKGDNGFEGLVFHAQTGELEVISHPMQKDGQFYIVAPDEMQRVGAHEIGFITRQGSDDPLILEVADSAASEMRIYSHEALLIEQPRHGVLGTGITY